MPPTDRENDGVIPLHPDGLPVDPSLLMFSVQLALTEGNASEAARNLGWSPSKGRQIIRRYPQLRDIARDALRDVARSGVQRWIDMHAEALQTIRSLMTSAEDERVRLQAANTVIERVEGKVPQKIEKTQQDPKEVMATITARYAVAYMAAQKVELSAAMEFAQNNPNVVEEWARKRGLLKDVA